MNSQLFLLILSFILFVNCGFVKRSGLQLLDGDGNDLYLKGVNLESWLMIQMLILSSAGGELRGETFFKTKLTEIIGQAETDEFMKKLYGNFITEDDIIAIAELGFNNVRVNFNHIVLENMNEDPVTCCSESGWKIFDDLVQWCESAQVYVIFDLHSAPGGQSEFFVNDPDDDSSTHIWNDETNAARTEEIWRQIATRYKDKEIILGYDLLNEPGPPNTRTLLAMYERLTTAIRAVDQNHVVIVEANALGAFDDWTPVKDENTIYSSHLYQFVDAIPSRQIQTDAWRRDVIKRDKRPLYVGEFGHADNTWIRESVAMMLEPGYVGWSFWTWKKLNDLFVVTCLVDSPPKWQQFIDWANGKWFVEKPAKQDVLGVMDELMQGLRFDKKCLQQQTIAALVNGTSTSASHASSLSGVVRLLCVFVFCIYWQQLN